MTKPIVLTGTLVAMLVAGSAVYAAGPGGIGKFSQQPATFEELDADSDGEVTRAEMDANGQARFAAADTDNDGFLSPAELEARAQEGVKNRVNFLMSRADADKDGKLSYDEMRNAVPKRQATFEDLDTDNSGGLTKAEMEAGHRKFWQKRPKKG